MKVRPRHSVLLTAVMYNTFKFLSVCRHRYFILSRNSWRQAF